ncbi:YveK family protein [Ectobacillus polymachus]|uniref:YveK family protein n=1 Tax=Ectobacillus polymachus TaxID=1508806 RepID=UPI003A87E5F3
MEDKTIVFKDYARMLWKYSWIIVLITLLFTVASAAVTYYVIKPTYQAEAEILVNETNNENGGQLINLDQQLKLVGTYIEILKSPRIMDGVEGEVAKKGYNVNLDQKVQFENVKDTQVIKITVQNESPSTAALIANTYANYFQNNIHDLMKTNNVQLLSAAQSNGTPVKPDPIFNISIAFALGIMISILIIFLLGDPKRLRKKTVIGNKIHS